MPVRMPSPSGVTRHTSAPECSWCHAPAIGQVHAQWSIFDFVDYNVCAEHLDVAQVQMWNRTVDGQRAVDVWVTFWSRDAAASPVVDSP
jgi:hypothetical protein